MADKCPACGRRVLHPARPPVEEDAGTANLWVSFLLYKLKFYGYSGAFIKRVAGVFAKTVGADE